MPRYLTKLFTLVNSHRSKLVDWSVLTEIGIELFGVVAILVIVIANTDSNITKSIVCNLEFVL